MTTTRRLLAALVIAGSLAVPAGTASAAALAAATPDPSEGVHVSVEITEREAPAGPSVGVVGDGPFTVGGELVVRGTGLPPHTAYQVWLLSDPVLLATVTVGADGTFELVTAIPADAVPGEHRIHLVPTDAGPDVLSDPFLVVARTGDPDAPGTTPPGGTGGTSGSGAQASSRPGGLATTGTGLGVVAALAAVAVASGTVLRRRARRATPTS